MNRGRTALAISDKQLNANRRNALRSTGPRTETGKARSSQNARKHGVLANEVISLHENKGEFIELLNGLHEQFNPQTALEAQLVDQLAIEFWRSRRLAIAERVVLEEGDAVNDDFDERSEYTGNSSSSERISLSNRVPPVLSKDDMLTFGRYQTMTNNRIRNLLKMLREEQELRIKTIEAAAEPYNNSGKNLDIK